MSSSSFLPTKDADLASWSGNFSSLITATPTAYGLLASDATALAALVTSFTTALATATNPTTRTEVTVAAKDTSKSALVATLRSLSRRIQAYPPVTPAQKTALGLPVHNPVPSPTPPPATSPIVSLVGIGVRKQIVRLADQATPTRRARPTGTAGAEVYSYVAPAGTTPPEDLEKWRFEGLATRSEFEVDFENADAGKTSYILARWFNRKGETGPASVPLVTPVAA